METYFKSFEDWDSYSLYRSNNNPFLLVSYITETYGYTDNIQLYENEIYKGKTIGQPFTITAIDACEFYVGPLHISSLDGHTWFQGEGATYSLSPDDTLMLKSGAHIIGEDTRWTHDNIYETSNDTSHTYKVSGNILSLYYGINYNEYGDTADYYKCRLKENTNSTREYAFGWMFADQVGLVDAQDLILPYNVNRGIYQNMFSGCSSLITPPEYLPSPEYADDCYKEMFKGCSSMTSVPILRSLSSPKHGSLLEMFNGCSSITTLNGMYVGLIFDEYTNQVSYMFNDCSNLTEAPKIKFYSGNMSAHGMFKNCSSLTDTSGLNINRNGYAHNNWFYEAFSGCSSLTSFKLVSEYDPQFDASTFDGVGQNGTFELNNNLQFDPNIIYEWGIPNNWTITYYN